MSKKQSSMLTSFARSGALQAFSKAVERCPGDQPAKEDHDLYLLTALRKARPKTIPRDALQTFLDLYPRAYIQVFGANGMAFVCVEGELTYFVPQAFLLGEAVKIYSAAGLTDRNYDGGRKLSDWIKSGDGGVAGRHIFSACKSIALDSDTEEHFGPCVACGMYFPEYSLLEGHLCDKLAAVPKHHLVQGGLASPR